MVGKNKPHNQLDAKPIKSVNKSAIHQPIKAKDDNDFFSITDHFFEKKSKLFFVLSCVLTLLFSFLLFDVKVSDGGDDSAYIVRAFDFIHDFTYPGFQGALYPIILSIFVIIFGINLPILKLLSLVFICLHLFMFHKVFKKNIPPTVLYLVMLLISINASLLYFASQTYSEAFFLFIQISLFFIFFRYFISDQVQNISIKTDYKKYLFMGLMLFLAGLTKNMGYASFIAVFIFLILTKAWKQIAFTLGGFIIFFVPFEILKRIIWGASGLQVQSQGAGLLYKDYYNPSKGVEDFAGYFGRFIDNSNLYFSKHLFVFLGFKDEVTETTPFLTFLIYLLFGLSIYWVFKKNKHILFTAIYTAVMCFVTFIALQKQWDQGRILIIYFPFILIIIFGGLYYFLKKQNLKKLQFSFIIIFIIIFFSTLQASVPKVKEKRAILAENLSGNMLYGLSPDWVNFINMSKWAAKNIPANEAIGSRKPDISFAYSNRKFFSMYKVPNQEADSLLLKINRNKQHAIIVDMHILEQNPKLQPVFDKIRKHIGAFVNFTQNDESTQKQQAFLYVFYIVNDSNKIDVESLLTQSGIKFQTEPKTFFTEINKANKAIVIYEPDVLLARLEKSNVKYVIMASLRKNPRVKSGEIIDTINRYLYFMQLKFPQLLTEKHRIGSDEPATLIELHYDKKG